MSLDKIYQSIEDSTFTNLHGRKSQVFEIFPPDCEQMTDESFLSWKNSLATFLNQLPAPEVQAISGFQRLVGIKEEGTHWYKFYCLGKRLFLNTTDENIFLPSCKIEKAANAFELLLEADDFYSDVIIQEDYVHFNSTYFRLVNLYEMPKTLDVFGLQQFGDVFVAFKKIHPDLAKRSIGTQRKLHHANLFKTMRNLESEASYSEAEKMSEAMMTGEEQLFEAESWLLVKAKTIDELNQKTQKLISELKQREIVFLIESVSLTTIFPSVLFGTDPLFKRSHDCPTSYMVELLPLKKDSLMEEGYEFTTLDGYDVSFSLFNSDSLNFNALFTGVSGSGKSMCAQKVISEEIKRGAKAVIVDLGNSFDKMAQFYKANIFSKKFNPLQFKDPAYLKEFVVSVIPTSEITTKQKGKIFKTIQESLSSIETFGQLLERLENDIPEISLYFSEILEFFTDDEVVMRNLTYVNLSDYPETIKSPLLVYLFAYFERLDGRKILALDEVWNIMDKHESMVERSYRTFRKLDAAVVTITQSLLDFTSSNIGRVIADLSYYKFIFSQNTEGSSGLTSFDIHRIKQVSSKKGYYSEFYLKSENIRKILRFYPSDVEYVLFNTEPSEKNEFEKFFKIYGSFFDFSNVIYRFVDFKYHNQGIDNAI